MESKDKTYQEFANKIDKTIMEYSAKLFLTDPISGAKIIALANILITSGLKLLMAIISTSLKTKGDRDEAIVLLQAAIRDQIYAAAEFLEENKETLPPITADWLKDVEKFLKDK